jgi:hypothetical protein
MTTVESSAVFLDRCKVLRIPDDCVNRMLALGWDSYAAFGFASSYVPGQSDDQVFIDKIVRKVLLDEDHPSTSALRRLYYESYSLGVSELKRKVDRAEDSSEAPRKVPNLERASRFDRVKAKFSGMQLQTWHEPSHVLSDLASHMRETGVINYIPIEACTKRDAEICGRKSAAADIADLSSDLKRKEALMRRGIAMDMAGLLSFEVHQTMIEMFFAEVAKDAIPGYKTVSFHQTTLADQEIFRIFSTETRHGIQPGAPGSLPLDKHLKAALLEPKVKLLLMPMQGSATHAPAVNYHLVNGVRQPAPNPNSKRQRLLAAKRAASAPALPSKGAGKKGAAGKKGEGKGPPAILAGMEKLGPLGGRICWDFSQGKCDYKTPSCPKGEHVCGFKPCSSLAHGYCHCPLKK